jgi:hypothetical protein
MPTTWHRTPWIRCLCDLCLRIEHHLMITLQIGIHRGCSTGHGSLNALEDEFHVIPARPNESL